MDTFFRLVLLRLLLLGFILSIAGAPARGAEPLPLCASASATNTLDIAQGEELRLIDASYLITPTKLTTLDGVLGAPFQKEECLESYPAPKPGTDLWMRFVLVNKTSAPQQWRIGFSEYLIGTISLYPVSNTHWDMPLQTGREVPKKERATSTLRPQIPVLLASGESRTFYLQVTDVWGQSVTPYLMTEHAAQSQNEISVLVSALFLGFLAAILVVSLVLFRHSEIANYQYYSLYIATMLVSSILYDGWFHHLTDTTLDIVLMARVIEILFALAGVGYVQFCRNILRLDEQCPGLARFCSIGLGLLGLSVVFAVLDPWIFDLPFYAVALGLQMFILVIALMRVRSGLAEAKPVAASAGALFICTALALVPFGSLGELATPNAVTKHLIEQSGDIWFYAAILGEAVFMGIAIATRIRVLQARRIAATAEVLLLQNEARSMRMTHDEAQKQSSNRIEALQDRLIKYANEENAGTHEPLAPAEDRFIIWTREQIHARIADQNFGVRELSAALGTSEKTLGRRLKQSLGMTPVAFIRQERLNRARDLILVRQYNTVAETAHAVGFSSTGHFAKLYREAFGETPNATLRAAIRTTQE